MSVLRYLALGPLLAAVACAHAAPSPPPSSPASPASPVSSAPPGPGEWATWTHAQKLAYMTSTVMPAEREIFARFEPVRFAKLDCETCHGPGARDGTYRMPNPDLPKLVGGPGGFQELARVQPETLRFMQSVLVPETARLLNVPAFDMEKHVGFSCYQCHEKSDVAE